MLVFAPLSGLKTFISAFRVTLLGVLNVAPTSQRQVSPARRWRGRARPAPSARTRGRRPVCAGRRRAFPAAEPSACLSRARVFPCRLTLCLKVRLSPETWHLLYFHLCSVLLELYMSVDCGPSAFPCSSCLASRLKKLSALSSVI